MSQPSTALPAPEKPSLDDNKMTVMEHLIEVRGRLIWVVGTLLVCTLISMVFVVPILEFITAPLTAFDKTPQALGPTDSIGIFFKVSFTMGTAIALPMIIYQSIAFLSPGLYPHEKRSIILMLPGIVVLFAVGAAFAYFILLPAAVGFLQNFLGTVISQDWAVDRYINFVTRLVFWIGVAFELPLVMAVMARTGLISGRQLLGYWRQAVILIAVAAAAITPTVDPVNMTLVMGPLILLYLLSVGLAYALYRPREARDFSKEVFIPPDE
jgi:sec-independent protein translocase protein TatC